ncbi:MAG: hypothetical protein ACOZNI_32165 [Myxococcota bacterium]
MPDDTYEFTYAPDAAEQLLYWNADELPARFHEARRQAAIALLDDTFTLWQRHHRTARKVSDLELGTAWAFKVRDEAILFIAVREDGTIFAFQKVNRRDVEAGLNLHLNFDSARGRLIGGPVLDATGTPVRDTSNVGHPILTISAMEVLVSAIFVWGGKDTQARRGGAIQE